MKYGIPYTGSKNSIAEKIINVLPPAEHFYDLFGGGGAISHCALLSGKYKYVHYNELDPLVFKGFKMAVNGEFENENRWISREDFFKLKDSDPYVAICFSFGNNLRTYCYSKEKEPFKQAAHNFLFFNDKSEIEKYVPIDIEFTSDEVNTKRLEFQRYLKPHIDKIKSYCNCNSKNPTNVLQSLERLERLNNFNDIKNIVCTNLSYDELDFETDSVIYCDPPYIGTHKYKVNFNFDAFYEWARIQENIFISEYKMPNDFCELTSIDKICLLNKSHKKVQEKIFTNRKTYERMILNSQLLW